MMKRNKINTVLTLELLVGIEPETVFAAGINSTINFPNAGAFFQIFRWVAERGVIDDWVIYYLPKGNGIKTVSRVGHKLKDPIAIQKLVPCTEEVLARYRFE
jgi:hypothetical protein